jgi:hypothetical protein
MIRTRDASSSTAFGHIISHRLGVKCFVLRQLNKGNPPRNVQYEVSEHASNGHGQEVMRKQALEHGAYGLILRFGNA